MPTITEIFDSKKGIDIVLKGTSAPTPIKSLVFRTIKAIDSDVLPAKYWTKTLKAIPSCTGTTGAEPMSKTQIKLINYDFGSFFAQTDFTAQEQLNFEKMSGKAGTAELSRLINEDGMVSKDLYVENECACSITGKLSIKTRVNGDGSWDSQEITYGTVSTTTNSGVSWATAKKSEMIKDLKKMQKAIETQLGRKVLKKDIIYLASSAPYEALAEICESTQTNDNLKVSYNETPDGYDYMKVNGFKVFDIAADFIDAETQASSTKIANNYIQAIYVGKNAGHGLYYLKIPNVKAGFRPLPMISFPVIKENGKGFTNYFESKPITVFNVACSTKMLAIS